MARIPPDDDHTAAATLERIRRFDRQATLERLVAYLAHNLGSPLNVIEGRAAMMAAGQVADADMKRNARIIAEQSSRIVRFLREVVSSAAHRGPGSEATGDAMTPTADLGAIARAAVATLEPQARAKGRGISFENEAGTARVRGTAETLLVALTHVLENGIRATPHGGTLTVRVRREVVPERDPDLRGLPVPFVCVEVDDEGTGIEPDILPRLFQPFMTTFDDRQAIGLGLFIAQSIAKEHGGWLEGVNKAGRGACFILHVPEEVSNAE